MNCKPLQKRNTLVYTKVQLQEKNNDQKYENTTIKKSHTFTKIKVSWLTAKKHLLFYYVALFQLLSFYPIFQHADVRSSIQVQHYPDTIIHLESYWKSEFPFCTIFYHLLFSYFLKH